MRERPHREAGAADEEQDEPDVEEEPVSLEIHAARHGKHPSDDGPRPSGEAP